MIWGKQVCVCGITCSLPSLKRWSCSPSLIWRLLVEAPVSTTQWPAVRIHREFNSDPPQIWDRLFIHNDAIQGHAPGFALTPAMILDCWTLDLPHEPVPGTNCLLWDSRVEELHREVYKHHIEMSNRKPIILFYL